MIKPQIYMGGVNVTAPFSEVLKSISYRETIESESDTAEIVLADAEKKLLQAFQPARGTIFKIELVEGVQMFSTGAMELDTIRYNSPPSEMHLKLNSVPQSAKRGVNQNTSWEQCRLSKVAGDIAKNCGLRLFYDTSVDPEIKRVEQSGESDLAFLKNLCSRNALQVKVHNGKLIVFESAKYEKRGVAQVLSYNDARLISFDVQATANQIYGGAQVSYQSNNVADWLWSVFGSTQLFQGGMNVALTGLTGGGELNITEKVNNQGEAERLAAAKLREKNKKEFTLNIKLTGDFSFAAGNTLELAQFGLYNGKYLIETTEHRLDTGGYTTNLTAHKVLNF